MKMRYDAPYYEHPKYLVLVKDIAGLQGRFQILCEGPPAGLVHVLGELIVLTAHLEVRASSVRVIKWGG